jgi:hypothetical protein
MAARRDGERITVFDRMTERLLPHLWKVVEQTSSTGANTCPYSSPVRSSQDVLRPTMEKMGQVGDVRAHRRLGVVSVYRALAFEDGHVDVEVVRAPGLPAGLTFRLTAEAFGAMSMVDAVAAHSPSLADELADLASRDVA